MLIYSFVRFGADLATPLGGARGARYARASCDRCVATRLAGGACAARRRRCAAAQFCAPLHGCVARDAADARRPAAELGWVAPPRRAAEKSRAAVAEMRFVYGSGGWKRKSAWKVKRHRWCATRDVARALMRPRGDAGAPVVDEDGARIAPGTPVLLTDSAAAQWPLLALSWAQLRLELARLPIETVHVAPAASAASRRCFASPDYFAQMTRGPCDAGAPGAPSAAAPARRGEKEAGGDLDLSSASVGHRVVASLLGGAVVDAVAESAAVAAAAAAAAAGGGGGANSGGGDADAIGAFFALPRTLRSLANSSLLFRAPGDAAKGAQFLWLSSPAQCTHAHADQDFNLFVQVKGRKRFLLVGAEHQARLRLFPRIHPLWHKSRLVADRYADGASAGGGGGGSYGTAFKAMLVDALPSGAVREVILAPGEMLYVPPLVRRARALALRGPSPAPPRVVLRRPPVRAAFAQAPALTRA